MSDAAELVTVALSHAVEVYHPVPDDGGPRPDCPHGTRAATNYVRVLLRDVDDDLRPCRYCYEGYRPGVTNPDGLNGGDGPHRLGEHGRLLYDMDPEDFDARG